MIIGSDIKTGYKIQNYCHMGAHSLVLKELRNVRVISRLTENNQVQSQN